jgi:hypothetical protein
MNSTISNSIIEGTIIHIGKLAGASWHLKIHAAYPGDFNPDGITGYILPVFLGDAHQTGVVLQQFPVWNLEPLHHIVEIVITPGEDELAYSWVKERKKGESIHLLKPETLFKEPEGTESFYLIGDVNSLSLLYQLNRNLPFIRKVESLIICDVAGMFFPDIDNSYPFHYQVIYPFSPERVLDNLISNIISPDLSGTIFLLTDTQTNKLLHNFFIRQWHFHEARIKMTSFDQKIIYDGNKYK